MPQETAHALEAATADDTVSVYGILRQFAHTDIRDVGEKLDVSTILEGSVRMDQAAGRVRITAQLIETDGGFQLWSDTFDYELENIFALQEQIATSIVRELELEFSPSATDLVQPAVPRHLTAH